MKKWGLQEDISIRGADEAEMTCEERYVVPQSIVFQFALVDVHQGSASPLLDSHISCILKSLELVWGWYARVFRRDLRGLL